MQRSDCKKLYFVVLVPQLLYASTTGLKEATKEMKQADTSSNSSIFCFSTTRLIGQTFPPFAAGNVKAFPSFLLFLSELSHLFLLTLSLPLWTPFHSVHAAPISVIESQAGAYLQRTDWTRLAVNRNAPWIAISNLQSLLLTPSFTEGDSSLLH